MRFLFLFAILPFIQQSQALRWKKKFPEMVNVYGEKDLILRAQLDDHKALISCSFDGRPYKRKVVDSFSLSEYIDQYFMKNKDSMKVECHPDKRPQLSMVTIINYRAKPPQWLMSVEEHKAMIYSNLEVQSFIEVYGSAAHIDCVSDAKEAVTASMNTERDLATIKLNNIMKTKKIVCALTDGLKTVKKIINVKVKHYDMPKWAIHFQSPKQKWEGEDIELFGTLTPIHDPSGKFHCETPKTGRQYKFERTKVNLGNGNVVFRIEKLLVADSGKYSCMYTTGEGKIISNFRIDVQKGKTPAPKPTSVAATKSITKTPKNVGVCPMERFFLQCPNRSFCGKCGCNVTNPVHANQCMKPNPGCTFENIDGRQEWKSCCQFDCSKIKSEDDFKCDCKKCSTSGRCLDAVDTKPQDPISISTNEKCKNTMFHGQRGVCVNRCLSSQYRVPGRMGGECVNCTLDGCKNCFVLDKTSEYVESCTSCSFDTYMYLNEAKGRYECVEKCPRGTGDLQGKCTPCADSLCSECYANNKVCETCVKNSYKWQDHLEESVKCVENCVDGYYFDSLNWCLPCPLGCSKCSSLKKCDKCAKEYQLQSDGSCKSTKATTEQPTGGGCGFTCQMCEYNICIRCKYFTLEEFFEKKCVDECPEFYLAGKDRVCYLNTTYSVGSTYETKVEYSASHESLSMAKNIVPSVVVAIHIIVFIGMIVTKTRASPDVSWNVPKRSKLMRAIRQENASSGR